MKHPYAGAPPLQPRQHLLVVHGLQFARRAGEQRDAAPAVFQPQARCGPPRVLQHFRAFRHHRLAHIHRGHFAAQLPEAPFDVAENRVVAVQLAAQKLGHGFACQVVFRGAKSAACDNQRHAVQRIANRFG